MAVCFVVNCMTKYSIDKKIKFHKFPVDAELKKRWQLAVGRTDRVPGPYNLICSEHFTENDYSLSEFNNEPILKPDAVPTVFENGTKCNNTEEIKYLAPIEEINIKEEPLDTCENIKKDLLEQRESENSVFKPLQQLEMVLRPRKSRKSYLPPSKPKKPQNKKSKLLLEPSEETLTENIPENNLPPVKKITCYYNKEDLTNNCNFTELLDKEILPILKNIGPTVPDNSVIYFNKNADDASSRSIYLNTALNLKQNNIIIMPYARNHDEDLVLVAENNNNGSNNLITENNTNFNEDIKENSFFPVEQSNENSLELKKCEENLLANKLFCDSCVSSRKRSFECSAVEKYKETSIKYKKYWINTQRAANFYKKEIAKLKRELRFKHTKILALNAEIHSFTESKTNSLVNVHFSK